MRKTCFFIVLVAGVGTGRAAVINFGGLAGNATYNLCGDAQNVGNYYASQGVAYIGGSLGDPVNSLDSACRGQVLANAGAYPPSTSDINLLSQDDFAEIQFTSLVSSVSLDYVSLGPIFLDAYDSSGDLLAEIGGCPVLNGPGCANTDGVDPGSYSSLSVSASNIAYVTLGNTGLAEEYAIDDLSFTSQASGVPEPGSLPLVLVLVCLLGFGVWVRRRGASIGVSQLRRRYP